MGDRTSSYNSSGLLRVPGDPALGLSPLGGPSRDPLVTHQCSPGTVGIIVKLPDPNTGVPVDTQVGTVQTFDLRLSTADANPRWQEVWTVGRWDVVSAGSKEVTLNFVAALQGSRSAAAFAASDAVVADIQYNYSAFNRTAFDGLGAAIDGFLPGTKQYFKVYGGGSVTGWLYRSIDERSPQTGNQVYDLWVLSDAYLAPSEGYDVKLTPQTNPYADATAFLTAMNKLRGTNSKWLAVGLLYKFKAV